MIFDCKIGSADALMQFVYDSLTLLEASVTSDTLSEPRFTISCMLLINDISEDT